MKNGYSIRCPVCFEEFENDHPQTVKSIERHSRHMEKVEARLAEGKRLKKALMDCVRLLNSHYIAPPKSALDALPRKYLKPKINHPKNHGEFTPAEEQALKPGEK